MITSAKKLKDDYNITIGCMPECLQPLEKIAIEDTEVYISVSDLEPNQHMLETKNYYWFPIDEMGRWSLHTFKDFWRTIETHWGRKIYVHCTAGVNRSRCMVYSFLKYRLQLNQDQIMEYFPPLASKDPSFWDINKIWVNNQMHRHIPPHDKLLEIHLDTI
jgi:protein tyrosine phosphatase